MGPGAVVAVHGPLADDVASAGGDLGGYVVGGHVVVGLEGGAGAGRYGHPLQVGRGYLSRVGLEGYVHINVGVAGVLHQYEGLHAPLGGALGQVPGTRPILP